MTTTRIDALLERNQAFARDGRHEGALIFPKLSLFVIACIDPRVDPAHFLDLDLSEALVSRNVGGRVTPAVIEDVAFIGQIAEAVVPQGPMFEVAIIHHTQCGAGAFADEGFRHTYAERTGGDEAGLAGRAVLDPVETVRADVALLRASVAVPERVDVSGHVYDVATGLLRTTVPAGRAVAGAAA